MAEDRVLMVRLEDVHKIIKSIQEKYDISFDPTEQPWGNDPTIYNVSLICEVPKEKMT